ncbi:MAG TPA: DUF6090 family protein [Bacteroidales bacterium]|nr:DUF6090 family protein [Bacteroidales bacterium]HRZ77988.1 DUF6090 family protein [Bacteroidales bacterium]
MIRIGILIALQVNNWNFERAERKREVKYLRNIMLDMEKDIARLDFLIQFRKERMHGDGLSIDHMNGEPVTDLDQLSKNIVNSLMEHRFTPNNSTFTELASSGNLSLISNDSIKVLLLALNELHKANQFAADHEAHDYREYISKQLFLHVNLDRILPVYTGQSTAAAQGISVTDFRQILGSREYKNGLFILTIMSSSFIPAFEEMQAQSRKIIEMIQAELTE